MILAAAATARAQELPPELTQPVNDFANVIDEPSRNAMESLIRSLQQASGDVVIVATVKTFKPYGDIREYAVKMFENRGKGIGGRAKDNGLLVLLAVDDRQVRVEVGYDLEQFITDGFSGDVSRQYMAPEFRNGAYGAGLLAGVSRIIARVAQGRNVTLQGVRPDNRAPSVGSGGNLTLLLFMAFIVINIIGRLTRRRGVSRFGRGGWSGWNSGIGPFIGGGFGGGGGGGFGGGFGGFGGGGSGGGGGGASW